MNINRSAVLEYGKKIRMCDKFASFNIGNLCINYLIKRSEAMNKAGIFKD